MQPERFEIDIPQNEVDALQSRLEQTRWADDLGNEDWRYGVERGWLEGMVSYWRDEYDWRKTEKKINQLQHFKVTLDEVPLHFVHIRGKGANPTPLLLLHGWPWTFMDFYELIGPLTDPAAYGGDPMDSFDVVIPSLPGFGFSMPLTRTGLDVPTIGDLMAKLMIEVLSYDRFALTGGDFGAVISGQIAHAYYDHVIAMMSTIPLFPTLDLNAITAESHGADEQWMIDRRAESGSSIVSHVAVNINDPQTLAYALVDSPVGTAAWIWERRRSWSDCDGDLLSLHTPDFLCELASIYWLTRSIGSSSRAYWEHFASGMPIKARHNRKPVIEVPVAYCVHPKEVMLVPESIVAEHTNLKRWQLMQRGGHFGFAEFPEAMTDEIQSFFRDYR